jgi:periplasmic protein TonB
MAATADIWTEEDRLSTPLWVSAALHGGLFAALLFGGLLLGHKGENWGGTAGGEGGAITATMVSTIPLPSHAPNQNVLANESKGLSQTQPKAQETPPPDAIPIPARDAKKAPKQQTLKNQKVDPDILAKANNIVPFGEKGPAGNMFSTFSSSAGTGGIAVGGGDFGSRFQWYVDAVRRRVSDNWMKYEVDPRISNANRVYVTFDILRDGSPSNVQLASSSGVPSLDQSAVRAVQRVDRFNPLPPDYSGNRVSVEFYFEYKR